MRKQLVSLAVTLATAVACGQRDDPEGPADAAIDAALRDGLATPDAGGPDAAGPPPFCFVSERVTIGEGGAEGDSVSFVTDLSDDGGRVAFASSAANLVAGDTNGEQDVFVRDRVAETTVRASVHTSGVQGNDQSNEAVISGDGSTVSFVSFASNLTDTDLGGQGDVFVRDLTGGTTAFAGVSDAGAQANLGVFDSALSDDGRYVAIASGSTNLVPSDTNGLADVFVRDRTAGTTTMVSVDSAGVQGEGGSLAPSISDDGRHVLFASAADNLVPGDTNERVDVFVHDRQSGETTRATATSGGEEVAEGGFNGHISGDGNTVVFQSRATDLVAGDTNDAVDVFVHDRTSGETRRIHVDSSGGEADGDAVTTGTPLDVSDDGRFVVFLSEATNLAEGDTNGLADAFLHDRQIGTTIRVSMRADGTEPEAAVAAVAISGDGRWIAVTSAAALVDGDENGAHDGFLVENCLLAE